MSEMEYLEPDIVERIERAQKKAQTIVDGQADEEGLHMAMRWRLARYLGIGFFDEYFDKRTFDELVFELEMFKLTSQTGQQRGTDLLNSAPKKETESLFDDMVEADESAVASSFEEDSKKFMQTGEFKDNEHSE